MNLPRFGGGGKFNHRMTLTWHRETYRTFCPICGDVRILHRHPSGGDYFCHECAITINRALRRAGINPKLLAQGNPEIKRAAQAIIDGEATVLRTRR